MSNINENLHPHKNTCMVHSSITHNNQEMKQMFIRWWMDGLNVVYPYNVMLSSNKQGWNIDTVTIPLWSPGSRLEGDEKWEQQTKAQSNWQEYY